MDPKKIIMMVVVSVVFLVCSNKSTNTPNPPLSPSLLQGTWYLTSSTRDVYVTSNKTQESIDILGRIPGNGSLSVTGAYNVILTRLAYLQRYAINASTHGYNADIYPNYQLGIINAIVRIASFTANLDANNAIQFSFTGTDIDSYYDFDTTSYTLTVNNMVLQNTGQTDSVTVNGQLSTARIHLPANTPTRILAFSEDDPDSLILILNPDSTSVLINVAINDTSYGIWYLNGSVLTNFDPNQQPPDTLKWQASYAGNTMTVQRDSSHCEADPCDYTGVETFYNLEPGTVTNVMTRILHVFSH